MDTAIWVFSKVAWLLFDPDNGLLILLVLGAVLLYTGREKLGRRLVAIASVALLVLSIFP